MTTRAEGMGGLCAFARSRPPGTPGAAAGRDLGDVGPGAGGVACPSSIRLRCATAPPRADAVSTIALAGEVVAAVAGRPGLVSSRLPRLRRHLEATVWRKGDESRGGEPRVPRCSRPEGLVMAGAGRAPSASRRHADGCAPWRARADGGRRMPEGHESAGTASGCPNRHVLRVSRIAGRRRANRFTQALRRDGTAGGVRGQWRAARRRRRRRADRGATVRASALRADPASPRYGGFTPAHQRDGGSSGPGRRTLARPTAPG